ncbi:ArsA family ATPase [Streptomyces mobaraensis NBRC 13819 = DSM 40847]|uniref:Ion transporting ATPase n=1 Tax=Streptomyces mobaraensis (strain ATCC 29032 / DSM 40847 / JCM 4168 / NBRC 13819 / NCIMB 11159 / IPCR 16-22) TaxID=1223523 RepID=M3BFL1_STRM1|nr:ArsA-related P-loop ATPase [Streptomyces mobaraensis]EME98359.1 ion transporting ATPase [Streptomyces mobaraensis NBRC 13819 = DSM 40847]QTT73439.1 ArsA family ATPase [Streptomyces mobaraensis NBRC 13819 = DSM 40847]
MRTVLVTGPGGAGRTTVAAATALAAARAGRRVLLLTGDPGPVPGAVLGTPLPDGGGDARRPFGPPVEAAPGLWAARIATGEHFTALAGELQERGAALFDLLGAAPLDPEEFTELPGAEPLALLAALRAAHGAGERWELVVVDMPPGHDTVRLLALPGQLRRYLRRLLPPERQAARALRPVLAQLAGVPMPAQRLYELAGRWDAELAAVQDVLDAEGTTVHLVAEPGPLTADALRTVRAGLALHGCRLGALVANRLLPDGDDPWQAGRAEAQRTALKGLYEEYGAVPVVELPHFGRDPLGIDGSAGPGGLDGPAAAVGPVPPPPPAPVPTVEDRLAEDNLLVWRLPLPGAERDRIGLVRRGDELIVAVGPFRRALPLPSALRRCTVSGAGLRDGALCVRFTPDPELWPRTGR